jgi:anti-sigma regulatory factor (Ser/Thr protein kinase)
VSFRPDGMPSMVRIPPDPLLPAETRHWQETWSRQNYLELAADAAAIPGSRYHARLVLREWRDAGLAIEAELAQDVELVLAELVANAVAATQSARWLLNRPPVRLWLLAADDRVMIVVWDATTDRPVLRTPASDAESGRGLMLVNALATWGYYLPSPSHGGKVIHARLPRDAQ